MRVAVDLDSTLSMMGEMWLTLYNEQYGDDLTIDDITEWNIAQFTKCSQDEMFQIMHRPGFFLLPEPMPGSIEALRVLCQEHEVFIVTAYWPDHCVDKHEWVCQHFPFLDPRNVVFCNKKYVISADVLIDDSPHNHEGFEGISILFDRPWNQGEKESRLYTWEGFDLAEFLCKNPVYHLWLD